MTPSTPLIADTLERTSSRLTNHVSNFLALCGLDGVMSIQYAFSQLWLVTQPKCGARPPYADRQKYYSVGNKRQKKVEYLSLDLLSALARLARNRNLTVLVHLDLGNHNVRRVDRDLNSGTVRLLLLEALEVHNPLRTVDLDDTALRTLRRPRTTRTSSSLRMGMARICMC